MAESRGWRMLAVHGADVLTYPSSLSGMPGEEDGLWLKRQTPRSPAAATAEAAWRFAASVTVCAACQVEPG